MEDDKKLSYFFLGLGLGVAVGVLFAPKSGSETRELLRSKANDGADYAKRRASELRDQASETIDRGKQTIRQHKDNLSAAVEAGKQAYREAVNTPTD
ncbi:MAG TPA: YtxH domain-containing protein [Bryobacteraceae bacterium]|jgi:gas vesicle protein|nr:YtxH domain-containing protein [Bryobacteraceae bacterium]